MTYINFEFVYIVRGTTDFRVQLEPLVLPVHRVKREREVSRDTLDKRERREILVPEVTVVYSWVIEIVKIDDSCVARTF